MFCHSKSDAQSHLAFQHLNTSNGLSYIGVRDLCTDQEGNLWIATGRGINMFNGKSTTVYLAAEYPFMKNDDILQVTCDSNNRIWALTAGGNVIMIDEKRELHRVALYD